MATSKKSIAEKVTDSATENLKLPVTFKEFSKNNGEKNTENCKYKYVSVDTELTSQILKNGNDNKRQGKA